MNCIRAFNPLVVVVCAALLNCCTLAMMQQLSKPEPAKQPRHVEWSEAEPIASVAAADFARRSQGHALATYFPRRGWKQRNNDGALERSAGLILFLQRSGGAAVKGAEGEDGVCFQYNCALVQRHEGDWGNPFLDCAEHDMQKVTCASVRAFAP